MDILFSVVSVREKRTFKGHFIIIFLCCKLKVEKQRGKQEVSTVCMSFSKMFYLFISFASLYLSSNSVSAPIREGVFKQKVDRQGEGVGRELRKLCGHFL